MSSVSSGPRLRRSVLFVPGADPKKIERARGVGADTLVLDLEDAVPPEKKKEARRCVVEALGAGGFGEAEACVRINAPGTRYFDKDVAATAGTQSASVMLPKAERAETIAAVRARLGGASLLLLVESPLGVADALALGAAADGIEALCFGHADFSLQMGLPSAEPSSPAVRHARAQVALAAKARELTPVDCVYLAVKDEEGFRRDTELGIALGYEGRLCIHPRQVELANEIYTPSPEQIDYATRVVEGWARAQREATGVMTVDGKMVDAPLVAQQERILARARRASETGSP